MIERVWIFHCGSIPVPRSWIEKDAPLEFPRMPFLGALAEHAELGPILIDAPFGHEGPANVGRMTAGLLKTVGLQFRSRWAVVPRIEAMGFRASEVRHALMTHLHVDHTGGMKTLGRTTFHVSESEWGAARKESSAWLPAARGYAPEDYRGLEERVEPFADPAPLEEASKEAAEPAMGEDIFGDGSVRAVGLPGHSPGHVGYRLQMSNGETVLHVGDAAFALSHVTEGRELGRFPVSFAWDVDRAQQTLRALRRFHDDAPDVRLINSHDFGLFEKCRERPTVVA